MCDLVAHPLQKVVGSGLLVLDIKTLGKNDFSSFIAQTFSSLIDTFSQAYLLFRASADTLI